MSSYSSAFSRRDDDRRDPSRRDSYGHYSSRSSDYERDYDRGYRGREREHEHSREHNRDHRDRGRQREKDGSPRSRNQDGSPRQPPSSPISAAGTNSKTTAGANPKSIAKVLRQYGKLVTEQASININKEALEKVLETRRQEYERSMPKHAEFPSVPEFQKKFRDRDLGERRALEAISQKTEKLLLETSETFASQLLEALPRLQTETQSQLQSRDIETRFNEWKAGLDLEQESRSKMQSDALATQLNELKAQFQEHWRLELVAEQTKKESQFESLLAEVQKTFESKLKTAKDDVARAIQAAEEAKTEATQARREAEKAQKITAEMTAQLAKQATELDELRRAGLEPRCSSTSTSSPEVASLQEVAKTHTANLEQLNSNVADVKRRLDEAILGQIDIQVVQSTVDELDTIARHSQAKLERIDVDDMEKMHDVAMEWDKVKRDVSSMKANAQDWPSMMQCLEQLEEKVKQISMESEGSIPTALPATIPQGWLADLDKRQKQRLAKFAETYGVLIETEKKQRVAQLDYLKNELLTLKCRSQSAEALAQTTEAPIMEMQMQKVVKFEQDVKKLSHDMSDFTRKLGETNQTFQTANSKLTDKCDSLGFRISSLDYQFNNLSTKTLAQYIIGELEQLYPDSRALAANISLLDQSLKEVKVKISQLETTRTELNQLREFLKGTESSISNSKKRKVESSGEDRSPRIRTD